jgi:hypothetical protein
MEHIQGGFVDTAASYGGHVLFTTKTFPESNTAENHEAQSSSAS